MAIRNHEASIFSPARRNIERIGAVLLMAGAFFIVSANEAQAEPNAHPGMYYLDNPMPLRSAVSEVVSGIKNASSNLPTEEVDSTHDEVKACTAGSNRYPLAGTQIAVERKGDAIIADLDVVDYCPSLRDRQLVVDWRFRLNPGDNLRESSEVAPAVITNVPMDNVYFASYKYESLTAPSCEDHPDMEAMLRLAAVDRINDGRINVKYQDYKEEIVACP